MAGCVKCKADIPEGGVYCPMCGKKQVREPRKTLKRANGTGTVYKLSGRRKRPWVAAQNKIIIGYYETKTEGFAALAALAKKTINERYNMTLSEVYEAWFSEHSRDLSQSSIGVYKAIYKNFDELKEKKMRLLRVSDYQKIVDSQAERGQSHSAMAKTKQLVSQLSKWAIRENIMETNYSQFIKLPKQEKKEKSIFTPAEIKTLFENDSNDTVKLILIMIYTGVRIGELVTIERDNVFIDEGYLVAGIKTEAGIDRIIPVSNKVIRYVEQFYNSAPAGGLLIEGYAGSQSIAAFRTRDYYPVLDSLGIEKRTPHSTRHTFASLMSNADVKPETLQKIIGHADYSTTANVYIHKDLNELKAAINRL